MPTFIPTTPTGTDATVSNNEFFPNLSLNEFRDAVRVDKTVSDGNATDALRQAMLECNALLADWQAAQVALGYAALDDVPGADYGNATHYQHWYLIAVRQLAKGLLLEQERDYDARNLDAAKVDALNQRIDNCRSQHGKGISAFTGEPSGTHVALI